MSRAAPASPTAAVNGQLGDLNTYRAMIHAFARLGYACTTFDRFSPYRRDLILRHDVDIGLQAAVTMALVEQEQGWQATYFILLTTEFYNVMSKSGRVALRAIAEMGHDIGLHFDAGAYDSAIDSEVLIARECDILEQILGRAVRLVAPHRPMATCPKWLGMQQSLAGRVHPYQPRFFLEAAYFSDSPGYWAHGHPLDHQRLGEDCGVQLLTHPHLWYGRSGSHRDSRIRAAIRQRISDIGAHAEDNFSGFAWDLDLHGAELS